MNTPKPPKRKMITLRLPQSLLDRVKKFVEANKPHFQNRTQVIEVALEKLLKTKPY